MLFYSIRTVSNQRFILNISNPGFFNLIKKLILNFFLLSVQSTAFYGWKSVIKAHCANIRIISISNFLI